MKQKVNFNGTMLLCEVDYQPFEPDYPDSPGCDADVEVNEAIYIDSEGRACDVLELIATWRDVESFKQCVLESIHDKD